MILIIDCYLDDAGGSSNIIPLLQTEMFHVWRPTRQEPISVDGWRGVVISGSGACLSNNVEGIGMRTGWMEELSDWILRCSETKTPMLGLCFGHQMIGHTFGGEVFKRDIPEVGVKKVAIENTLGLFNGFDSSFEAFVSHEDELDDTGRYDVLASTKECPVHAIKVHELPIWGVQFHVEMMEAEAHNLLLYRQQKHLKLEMDLSLERVKLKTYSNKKSELFQNFLDICIKK